MASQIGTKRAATMALATNARPRAVNGPSFRGRTTVRGMPRPGAHSVQVRRAVSTPAERGCAELLTQFEPAVAGSGDVYARGPLSRIGGAPSTASRGDRMADRKRRYRRRHARAGPRARAVVRRRRTRRGRDGKNQARAEAAADRIGGPARGSASTWPILTRSPALSPTWARSISSSSPRSSVT